MSAVQGLEIPTGTMKYWDKLNEAEFNFKTLQKDFEEGNLEFEHSLNNFLSSAQSVFWILNKELNGKQGYKEWSSERESRLSNEAKIFKELRNISIKEGPIKHEGAMLGMDFGPEGIILSSNEALITPMINIQTGRASSDKARIESPDGGTKEISFEIFNDFSVKVESNGKNYFIDRFIKSAKLYLADLKKEIESAEQRFLVGDQ